MFDKVDLTVLDNIREENGVKILFNILCNLVEYYLPNALYKTSGKSIGWYNNKILTPFSYVMYSGMSNPP